MPFLMNSSFIEKYALTLEPYPKIKADLGLTTDEFYALTKTLASEIEVARKVRQLYQRKGFKKIGLLDFYNWWTKQAKICNYCGINEQQLSILFEKLKEFNKRPTRGKTLELDRRIANKEYDDIDNLVLCCYICNNAKSDFFNHEQFIPVGQSIKLVWTKILNPE
jgi:hypothetical protein